jgi:hypothetical protein
MNKAEYTLMLYKLVTGELIIGLLDNELTDEHKGSEILYIKSPAVIGFSSDSFYMTKYNHFSKLDMIMLMGKQILYVDMPSDEIQQTYTKYCNPVKEEPEEPEVDPKTKEPAGKQMLH